MKLDIATPKKSFPTVEVDQIVLPTLKGEIMILPGHAHLVSSLGKGTLTYQSRAETKSLSVNAGVVEVKNDHVIVLSDEID
jgi:F-type H+-transporting ATPase subunit epsilon